MARDKKAVRRKRPGSPAPIGRTQRGPSGRARRGPRATADSKRRPLDPDADSGATAYAAIYAAVRAIPRGRVATYGQIAELARARGGARQIGYALAALHDDRIPWHRVVNARGEISARSEPSAERLQRQLLVREGIVFNARGRIPLERFRWLPGSA